MQHIHKYIDIAERIITIIRPRFYNKLTWFIVFTGIFFMGTPLWERIISAAIGKYFNINHKVKSIGF